MKGTVGISNPEKSPPMLTIGFDRRTHREITKAFPDKAFKMSELTDGYAELEAVPIGTAGSCRIGKVESNVHSHRIQIRVPRGTPDFAQDSTNPQLLEVSDNGTLLVEFPPETERERAAQRTKKVKGKRGSNRTKRDTSVTFLVPGGGKYRVERDVADIVIGLLKEHDES